MKKTQENVKQLLNDFYQKLPHSPDGRIDYSHSDIAPVITIFITHHNTFLLLKRSEKVRTYKKKWNTVAGYLDDPDQTLFEKILEELSEELSLGKETISSYSFGKKYQFTDHVNNKTWIVHPSLVTLTEKPKITLDWEHTDYKWITPNEIQNFDTVPNLKKSMKRAISLAHNE
jgi:8-oxo-dGTP pyrophosphatase MutT (NUDIX family)